MARRGCCLQGDAPCLNDAVLKAPWVACAALLALAVACMGLWLPSVGYDDNAGHLYLPSQLMADGYYHLDFSTQAFALNAWMMNVLNGIAAVLALDFSRPAVNALWLALLAVFTFRLARTAGADGRWAWCAVLLVGTFPLTLYYGSVMQVDLACGVVFAALLVQLVQAHREHQPGPWLAAIYIGGMLGLKPSNAFWLLLPLAWIIYSELRQGRFGRLVKLGLVAAVTGLSSYVYALLLTGNPVFPLYNSIFKSPYFPLEDFKDTRWLAGMQWDTPWLLTFRSMDYMEAAPGAMGFLLPVLAVGDRWDRP